MVLHDSVKLWVKVPPQFSPPKFCRVAVVWGSVSWLRNGNSVLGVATPSSRATDAVIVLKLDPGG